MKEKLKIFITRLFRSFDNHSEKSLSARKLTAFTTMFLVVIIDVKWLRSDQWQYIEIILGLHFTFILALLGLTTWQNLKQKNENTNSDTVNP